MSKDKEILEYRQNLRDRILKGMFDNTIGASKDPTQVYFTPQSVSEGLQVSVEDTLIAMQFLAGKHLIEEKVQGYDRYSSGYTISSYGISEIERLIENPEARTEYRVLNVVQHFNAPVGSVQNAPNSTAQVIQNNVGVSLREVLSLIDELQAEALSKLPPEKQEEVKDDLEVLKTEVTSEKKDSKRLKFIWKNLQSGVLGTIDVATKLAGLAEKLKSLGLLDS